MLRNLYSSASPLAISIGFDADEVVEGGTPAPSPAPAPAPSLMGGEDEQQREEQVEEQQEELTDEQKAAAEAETAKAEEDRRAALTDEERAEEDRRAALTDEERAAEDAAKAGAPEEYDFSGLFEGEDAPQLDEDMLGEFTGILKEDNLTQEQANRYMGFAQKLQEKWLGEVTQAHVDARAAWRQEAQADPEIGGDKFAENLAIGKKALDAFGTPALKELLNETGIGDHPEVIRFFHNVGVVNREHDFVKSGRTSQSKPFYDHPTSQPGK